MTKSARMRWKVRSSKKPVLAREANEAAVFGARLTSRAITMSPQFVVRVTLAALEADSFKDGFLSLPAPRGLGAATFSQPAPSVAGSAAVVVLAGVDAVVLAGAFFLSSPQPATAR